MNTSQLNAVGRSIRYDYMDNLRALALITGVFFHAAMAYSPLAADFWPSADPNKSMTMSALALFPHMFRMPLFFLIAGFFSCLLLDKRGVAGFIKHRSIRILAPFIVFLPLVGIGIYFGLVWAMSHVDNAPPFFDTIAVILNNKETPEAKDFIFRTGHLWFLYNLFMFCCVAALFWNSRSALFTWLQNRLSARLLVFLLPLLLIPSLSTVISPYPAPERFYPELWSFGFFGIFYVLGFLVYRRIDVIDQLFKFVPLMAIISVIAYSYFFTKIYDTRLSNEMVLAYKFSWALLYLAVIESFVAVYMTLTCLVLAKLFLNRRNKWLSMFAHSSYWVYIVHLPVLLMIQYALIDLDLGPWTKFSISSSLTLLVGYMSYLAFVRNTPIGCLLNGSLKGKAESN